MRPGTFSTPGLGGKVNGQIDQTLRTWKKERGERKAMADASFSANKRNPNRKNKRQKAA